MHNTDNRWPLELLQCPNCAHIAPTIPVEFEKREKLYPERESSDRSSSYSHARANAQ